MPALLVNDVFATSNIQKYEDLEKQERMRNSSIKSIKRVRLREKIMQRKITL